MAKLNMKVGPSIPRTVEKLHVLIDTEVSRLLSKLEKQHELSTSERKGLYDLVKSIRGISEESRMLRVDRLLTNLSDEQLIRQVSELVKQGD